MVPLTHIISTPQEGRTPLLVEVPVAPEVSPYLVTSSQSVTWVNRAHGDGCVRAAVREIGPNALFREFIEAVATKASADEWGNVLPPTMEGLMRATAHLSYYGFEDVEVLSSDLKLGKVQTKTVGWIPAGWGLVVPTNRDFVGTTLDFGKGRVASVIHNAARGLAILRP